MKTLQAGFLTTFAALTGVVGPVQSARAQGTYPPFDASSVNASSEGNSIDQDTQKKLTAAVDKAWAELNKKYPDISIPKPTTFKSTENTGLSHMDFTVIALEPGRGQCILDIDSAAAGMAEDQIASLLYGAAERQFITRALPQAPLPPIDDETRQSLQNMVDRIWANFVNKYPDMAADKPVKIAWGLEPNTVLSFGENVTSDNTSEKVLFVNQDVVDAVHDETLHGKLIRRIAQKAQETYVFPYAFSTPLDDYGRYTRAAESRSREGRIGI